MDSDITFRPIKSEDYDDLADIISDTWDYGDYCSAETAHRMGLLYLAGCLCEQTFTQVAIRDGKPVGVIMGNDVKHSKTPLKYKWMFLKNTFILSLTKKGRLMMEMFGSTEIKLDNELFEETGKDFDAQLSFFAVKSTERGTGVGDRLYKSLMNYFRGLDAENFYLFTDTSCNYGFYLHKGLKKLNELRADFSQFSTPDETYFLFAKEIA